MMGLFLPLLLLNSLTHFTSSSAGEDFFTLTYNGGKIMTQPVTLALLWFGDGWTDSGRKVIRNAVASLSSTSYPAKKSEVPTLRNWWEIVMQYTDSSNTPVTSSVKLGPECLYTGSSSNVTLDQVAQIGRSLFNETSIKTFGWNLTCTQVFDVDETSIYHILFSDWVMFWDAGDQMDLINSCSGDLGELEIGNGVSVKMVWSRAPQYDDNQCSMFFEGNYYLGPPNGDHKIDSLVGYMLAKIADEVTNRDGRGWSIASGISSNSIGDGNKKSISGVCADLLHKEADNPLFRDMEKNVSFNVIGLDSYKYMVQYIWSKQVRNCALKLSEPCGADAVTLTEPKGYLGTGVSVNHTGGLQPYPPNEKCQWKVQYLSAKFISFNPNYLNITADDGLLKVCKWDSMPMDCYNIGPDDRNSDKRLRLKGSSAYVKFTSNDVVSIQSRGWELRYSAGLCDGKEDVYHHQGNISYTPPTGFSHVEGLNCQWILHGKPGTPVSLSFTRINISKNLDFLGIYNGTEQQMVRRVSNFSGLFVDSNLPRMNLTGKVMIVFTTRTDQGTGWSANFYISSPEKQHKSPLLIAIIVTASVLIGSSIVLISLVLVIHQRQRLQNRTNANDKLKLQRLKIDREEDCVGDSPSATVYRAVLSNGCTVAVKSQRETRGSTEIEEEILLRTSSHPNIISLLGYAQDGMGRRLLVFEFMSRGSLSSNLRERGEILSWEKRLDIALQVSSSVQLLHMYLKPPIYHGNLKSENVLLDDSWNAKLSGFGSANYCTNDGSTATNQSEMAEDVLNFGLLLVELLRGEILTNRTSGTSGYRDEINEIVGVQDGLDPRLELPVEQNKIIGLEKLGDIANWCTNGWRFGNNTNPKIGDVVLGLKQVKQLFVS